MTDREDVIPALVEVIADHKNVQPQDLEFSLYDHIETDAIERLVISKHIDWTLTFPIPDHTVEIRGTGEVAVDGTTVGSL